MSERFEDLPLDSRVHVIYERAVSVERIADAFALGCDEVTSAAVDALRGWYAVLDAENELVCLVPPGGIDEDANADDVPRARVAVVAAMLNQVAPGGRAELLRGEAVQIANNQRANGKHAIENGEFVGTPAWVTDAVVEAYALGVERAAPLKSDHAERDGACMVGNAPAPQKLVENPPWLAEVVRGAGQELDRVISMQFSTDGMGCGSYSVSFTTKDPTAQSPVHSREELATPPDGRSELHWDRGYRAGLTGMLAKVLGDLGYQDTEATRAKWVIERESIVRALRDACADLGDNDWPATGLSLADVVEKHLHRHFDAGRIVGTIQRLLKLPSSDSGFDIALRLAGDTDRGAEIRRRMRAALDQYDEGGPSHQAMICHLLKGHPGYPDQCTCMGSPAHGEKCGRRLGTALVGSP